MLHLFWQTGLITNFSGYSILDFSVAMKVLPAQAHGRVVR
jgi:hypothetical protein